jgi:hypothetical protein
MQTNIAGKSVSHNAIMRDNTLGALINIIAYSTRNILPLTPFSHILYMEQTI